MAPGQEANGNYLILFNLLHNNVCNVCIIITSMR